LSLENIGRVQSPHVRFWMIAGFFLLWSNIVHERQMWNEHMKCLFWSILVFIESAKIDE